MAFSLSALQLTMSEVNMNSASFRNLIENHLALLRTHSTTTLVTLNKHDEYKFTGDFYQLLHTVNVTQDLWWIILRLNGLHSPLDYTGELIQILIPSMSKIKTLLTRNLNSNSIL